MPAGFLGQAVKEYLKEVEGPLEAAAKIHSRDPFRDYHSSVVSPPELPFRSNRTAPHTADEGGGHATGFGTNSNIVVSQENYDSVASRIHAIDDEMAAVLNKIAQQIRELCGTAYILPKTTPKVEGIEESVAASLPESSKLGDNVRGNACHFTGDITAIR